MPVCPLVSLSATAYMFKAFGFGINLLFARGQRGKRGRWRYFTRTMPRGYCELGRDGVVEGEEEETSNNNNKRINNTVNINTYINNNTNAPGLL